MDCMSIPGSIWARAHQFFQKGVRAVVLRDYLHALADEIEARDRATNLATLSRLLRCQCGHWMEALQDADDAWRAACSVCLLGSSAARSPAEAVMAFHREHGGEK